MNPSRNSLGSAANAFSYVQFWLVSSGLMAKHKSMRWSVTFGVLLLAVGFAPPVTSDEPDSTGSASGAPVCYVVSPAAYRQALMPWVADRQSQGIEVRFVDSAVKANDVKANLLQAGLDASARWIMLVGDCSIRAAENANPEQEVPTFYRLAGPTRKFGTTDVLAGDAPYGDVDQDGIPEVSVGRLPVDSAEQLTDLVTRILAYESSRDFGRWRDTVQITAGVGGFGYLADAAIESATRSILLSSLPPAVKLGVTYASPTSPFNPGAGDFFPAVLRRYQEGSLFWVYMGHGQVTELDRIAVSKEESRPVLASTDVDLLARPANGAPIAVMLACYSGAYDATVDCLAERMLFAKGGPIAVLAGSRVTMPYGNAIAAQGLMHAVYEDRVERLGEAWLRAQRELATDVADDPHLAQRRALVDLLATALSPDKDKLGDERLEHLHLYNLLGDPTLRLRHPQELTLAAPRSVVAGEAIEIQGVATHGGELTLSVCYLPGSVPVEKAGANGVGGAEGEVVEQVAIYEQANCIEVAELEIANHQGGPFKARIVLPANVRGSLKIVGRMEGGDRWSTGATPIIVRPQ